MGLLPDSIQRPPVPVLKTYTPPGGAIRYKVRDGDSWVSLAQGRGMDPWALIRFNYPGLPADKQQAARQVNWYLKEYVGCLDHTPDHRNYVFSSGDTPGEIWLPPAGSNPRLTTPDDIARQEVLDTLRSPAIGAMNFGVGHLFIPSSNFEMVAQAIERGFITVKQDAARSHSAEYNWADNRITVPAYAGHASVNDRALIIHECMHAIFDIRKITTRVEEAEGMAYLAQMLYLEIMSANHPHTVSADPADPLSWVSWQLIFNESKRLAPVLRQRYRVTEAEAAILYSSIKNANFYRARAGKSEAYDGLPDAYY